jgi:outer membrane autotransporter protein
VAQGSAYSPATLTVTGNYVGDGGVLRMRTQLGADASPTDRLVVGGSVSGKTTIQLTNAGGLGAETTGDGIELVHVGGTSAADAFTLAGGSIDAGAFTYRLHEGPRTGLNANWYLRTQAADPGPGPGPDPEPPAQPEYRKEVPWVTPLPNLVARGSLDMLATLHKRVGDETSVIADGSRAGGRGWGRVFGGDTRQDLDSSTPASTKGHELGFQAGMDVLQSGGSDGDHRVGFYLGHLQTRADVSGLTGATEQSEFVGKLQPDTTSAGLYWT